MGYGDTTLAALIFMCDFFLLVIQAIIVADINNEVCRDQMDSDRVKDVKRTCESG